MSIYISNSLYIAPQEFTGDAFNANNPVIGYHSVLTPSDITAPSSVSVRPATNAWTPDTAQVWEGEAYSGSSTDVEQYLQLANSNNELVDYIGIARHNFGTGIYQYNIQTSTDGGSTWEDLTSVKIVPNNNAIVEFFNPTTAGLFRIKLARFGVTEFAAPIVGHVKLGRVLVLQRRIYVGHQPATLSKKVKRSTYGSENGQYLGQVIQRSYLSTRIDQENNSPDFVRENIVPFIDHVAGFSEVANTAPATFFWAWRPGDYPKEVVYGWTRDDIEPQNQGGDKLGGRMSWGCNVEAIV